VGEIEKTRPLPLVAGYVLFCDKIPQHVTSEEMPMAPKLILVRHPESIGNLMKQDERAAHTLPNHLYPVTEVGDRQATITAEFLRDAYGGTITHILTSTFLRNQFLARTIAHHLKIPQDTIYADSRLNEKWDGVFHELSKDEVAQRYPEQLRLRNRSDYYHFRPIGGENCPDVELRARSLLTEIRQSPDCGWLLVVHGRWLQVVNRMLHNIPVDTFLDTLRNAPKNCSVTVYETLDPLCTPSVVVPWEGKLEVQKSTLA
jgi:broad specificity phosphatase PhoE